MIFFIIQLILLVIIPMIFIFSKRNFSNKVKLCLSQMYNFIIGFSSWIIVFFALIHFLKIFGEMQSSKLLWAFFGIILLIIYAILLIPTNIKLKKNIENSNIKYILLSTFSVVLGLVVFILLVNTGIFVL